MDTNWFHHVNHVTLRLHLLNTFLFEGSYDTTGDLATLSGSWPPGAWAKPVFRKSQEKAFIEGPEKCIPGCIPGLVVSWRVVSNKKKLGDLVGGFQVLFLQVNKFTTIDHLWSLLHHNLKKLVNLQIKIGLLLTMVQDKFLQILEALSACLCLFRLDRFHFGIQVPWILRKENQRLSCTNLGDAPRINKQSELSYHSNDLKVRGKTSQDALRWHRYPPGNEHIPWEQIQFFSVWFAAIDAFSPQIAGLAFIWDPHQSLGDFESPVWWTGVFQSFCFNRLDHDSQDSTSAMKLQ